MLEYSQANDLLIKEFDEMKTAYENDLEEYNDGDENSCYSLYGWEFLPYIVKHLEASDDKRLEKIFGFVERIHELGDDRLANMVGVEIIEGLYFGGHCKTHREILQRFCGKKTLQSFLDSFEDYDPPLKDEWEKAASA